MTVATAPALSAIQFHELGRIARERAGQRLDHLALADAESRLAPRLGELGIESFDLYLRYLTCGPHQSSEFQETLGLLSGDEGGFFDDGAQFEAFNRWALPRILDARKRSRRLRIWCAGCARGCEAYSLAILVDRALGLRAADWRIEILGTDIRQSAVAAATAGRYSADILRAVPPELRRKYFREDTGELLVEPSVREMTLFETHNLLDRAGARRYGVWDAIFCRGVVGSMDAPCAQRTLAMMTEQLAMEGFLFLGQRESIVSLEASLRPIPLPCAGFQVRSNQAVNEVRS